MPSASEGASSPPSDPLREKVDEVVLTALTSDFQRYRRRDSGAPASGERSSDRQLDAALASFRGARLRRDATKSSQGAARAFDFAAVAQPGPDDALAVGYILKNRFVLDRQVGRGGMGVVYRAVDRRRLEAMHNQPYVAVKLLTGDIRRSPDALRALEAEARRAQELAHPNIVNTYDFDRDGGHVFIVMELLEGRPLDAVLRESPDGLGFEASRKIVEGICAGLGYAHARGVVHCDLKPANVYVESGGGVKLLDFGIATAGWAGGFDLASLNAYTLAYASPEMLQGDPRDPRDDVYALGCLVYVVLTGRHPFERASALEARDRGLEPKRPPRIPGPAWAALLGALAFDRAKRVKNASAFQREYGASACSAAFDAREATVSAFDQIDDRLDRAGIGVVWFQEAVEPAAAEAHHVLAERQNGGDRGAVHARDAIRQLAKVEGGQGLVDDEQELRDFQPPRELQRNGGSLIVLVVRSQDEDQRVRDRDRQQRLLIDARVRVDQQIVEPKAFAEIAESVVEEVDVVAFLEDARDLAGLRARGHQHHCARRSDDRAARLVDDGVGHVDRGFLDAAAPPQVVIQGQAQSLLIDVEENMNARRLDVGVDDRDALSAARHGRGDVGGRVRFSGPAAIRVRGHDLGHARGSVIRMMAEISSCPP
jgi:hypothetical protein